jgi:glycine hydroxymethyltransferase
MSGCESPDHTLKTRLATSQLPLRSGPHTPPIPLDGSSEPADLVALAAGGAAALKRADPALYRMLAQEAGRQRSTLLMVASASGAAPSVLACGGTPVSNVTTEGGPGADYHAGSAVVDDIQRLAVERAQAAFGARYANVQPHSGTSANLSVITSLMSPGDTLLGFELDCGGHLSHGSLASALGRYFNAVPYGLDDRQLIDYDDVHGLAQLHRPRLIISGVGAYPRTIDFARLRAIADEVEAYLLADISQIAGLVAAGLHPSPIDVAHVVTTSTYKQLYGPRGGLILMGRDADAPAPDGRGTLASAIQRAVFPFTQGTPDLAAVAAKARALAIVPTGAFRELMGRVAADAQAVAERLVERGHQLVTGGTDTHMVLVDLRSGHLTAAAAEEALECCGIIVNRNPIAGDTSPARETSGLRLGTNALALRGLGPSEARRCADLVADVLDATTLDDDGGWIMDPLVGARTRRAVADLCARFPLADGEGAGAAGTRAMR